MAQTRTYVGLDIGTTKISCIIAEHGRRDGDLKIVGVGTAPVARACAAAWWWTSRRRSPASSARSRRPSAWPACRSRASTPASPATTSARINSRGVIAVSRKDNEIAQADVDRVVEAAKAVAIPMDREIIHVIPQEFIVDDQDGIKDPVGMSGVRLEAEVHIITGAVTSAKNICRVDPARRAQGLRPGARAAGLGARRARPTTSATWAWCCSTSAAAPPTSRCSTRARSATPRSCRSAART